MCPDRKLQWFKNHKFSSDRVKKIKNTVVKYWKEKYAVAKNTGNVSKEKEKAKSKQPVHIYSLLENFCNSNFFFDRGQNGL